jgi:hypothetical protein
MAQKGAPARTQLGTQEDRSDLENPRRCCPGRSSRLQKGNPTRPFLGLRQKALSNILAGMLEGERVALDAEVKRIGREGNSEEEKRR